MTNKRPPRIRLRTLRQEVFRLLERHFPGTKQAGLGRDAPIWPPIAGLKPDWPIHEEWPVVDVTVNVSRDPADEPAAEVVRLISPFLASRKTRGVRWVWLSFGSTNARVSLSVQVEPLPVPELSFEAFAAKYCERQEQTEAGLREILDDQKLRFRPYGWMLLECQDCTSSRAGSLAILPFGPDNKYHAIPDHPISPRGLASDMSAVVAVYMNYPTHVMRSPKRETESAMHEVQEAEDAGEG